MCVAFSFTAFLPVLPQIETEFNISSTAATLGLSTTLIMRPVGALVFGHVADVGSKRLALVLSCLVITVTSAMTAMAQSASVLFLARGIFGLGMGGVWPTGAVLSTTNVADRWRGVVSGALSCSWALGAVTASALLSLGMAWRAVLIVGAFLPLVPVLTLVVAGPRAAQDSQGLHDGIRTRISQSISEVTQAARDARFKMVLAVTLAVFIAYYSLVSPYAKLLESLGNTSSSQLLFRFNCGMMAGTLLLGFLLRFARMRTLFVIPSLLFLPIIPLYVGTVPQLLPAAAFLAGFLGVGCSGLLASLLTHAFPDEVRARMIGICFNLAAVVSALLISVLGILSELAPRQVVQGIAVSISQFLIILAAACLLKSTRWVHLTDTERCPARRPSSIAGH